MKLYKGTGCHIEIVGKLVEIPKIQMNSLGELLATIKIQICTPNQNKASHYDVLALEDIALRVKQYGFPGVYLWIEGVFKEKINNISLNNTDILAEKIVFLDNSEPNDSSQKQTLNDDIFPFLNAKYRYARTGLHVH